MLQSFLPAIFLLELACSLGTSSELHKGCNLPKEWHGSWYRSGRHHNFIEITNDTITEPDNRSDDLGRCLRQEGENFLFRRLSDNCTKCAFIEKLHVNVLRLKESSHCEEDMPNKGESLCQTLVEEEAQYLIRGEDVGHVKCPFRNDETFEFDYRLGGETHNCSRAKANSHTEICYSNTQWVFKYEACNDDLKSEAKAQVLSCIGEWSENDGTKFLIAKVEEGPSSESSRTTGVEGNYRCFVFKEIEDPASQRIRGRDPKVIGYSLSISGSPTCPSTQSPEEGALILSLKQGERNNTFCSFPTWLRESGTREWSSLDGRTRISSPLEEKTQLVVYDQERKTKKYSCRQEGFDVSRNSSIFLVKEINDTCGSNNICLRIIKNSEMAFQLSELRKGEDLTQAQFENICLNSTDKTYSIPHPDSFETFLAATASPTPCPMVGRFRMEYFPLPDLEHDHCTSKDLFQRQPKMLKSGCGEESDFVVADACGDNVARCLGSWKDASRTFFIIRFSGSPLENRTYCIAYDHAEKFLYIGSEEKCPVKGIKDLRSIKLVVDGDCATKRDFDSQHASGHPEGLKQNNFMTVITVILLVFKQW